MKPIKLYQVDAFADRLFTGNPAAVIILDKWLPVATMQNIALENNLSETAFIVPDKDLFLIRYFTPLSEVELCGHATLASGFVIFNFFNPKANTITFRTQKRGDLFVKNENDKIIMDFPTDIYKETTIPDNIESALQLEPSEAYWGLNDLMLVYENEEQIMSISPNFEALKKLKARGVLITAKGNDVDFVSRFFAPKEGINEDPVTGSAHTTLIPYWHKKTGKNKLLAKQLSYRKGIIYCEYNGSRVKIGGKAVLYLTGTINL